MKQAILIFTDNGVWGYILNHRRFNEAQYFKDLASFQSSFFKKYLNQHPSLPLFLLVDTEAQNFSIDNLTPLKWGDQLLLIRNKIKAALANGNAAGYRRLIKGHYLQAVIEVSPFLKEWSDYLRAQSNPICKIVSLPTAVVPLLKKIKAASPWVLLIYGQEKIGYRHVIIFHHHFYFSRAFKGQGARHAEQEIQNTLSFIESQTGIGAEHILRVDLTASTDQASLQKLSLQLGVMSEAPLTLYPLLGAFVATHKPCYLSLSYPVLSHQKVIYKIRSAFKVTGAIFLACSLFFLGQGLITHHVIAHQTKLLHEKTSQFLKEYGHLNLQVSAFVPLLQQQEKFTKKVAEIKRLREKASF